MTEPVVVPGTQTREPQNQGITSGQPAGVIGDTYVAGDFWEDPTNACLWIITVPGPPITVVPVVGVAHNAIVAATAAIAATETIVSAPLPLVAGASVKVGSIFKIHATGTCTSSNADLFTFNVRAGTLGTKADAVIATAAVTSAGAGAAIPFDVEMDVDVRTLGASGTVAGSLKVDNTGITGLVVASIEVPFTGNTFATTTATFIELCAVSAAATTACTFQACTVELVR
jgi:hypothetical protein